MTPPFISIVDPPVRPIPPPYPETATVFPVMALSSLIVMVLVLSANTPRPYLGDSLPLILL
jgi:hypothetical protein